MSSRLHPLLLIKKYTLRLVCLLTILLLAAPVSSLPAEAAKKKTRTTAVKSSSKKSSSSRKSSSGKRKGTSKQKSSATAAPARTSSSTSKKKTSSTRRRRSQTTSYASTSAAAEATALDQQPARTAVRPVSAANSKRKIKVAKPDLDSIRQRTLDPRSPRYFPKLMAKYNRNDTTMTTEEYRDLYLGYMFQEDYDPYRTSIYAGQTNDLRLKATHTKEEIDTIRKYAELALKDNPFDLRQMAFLVHVLKEKRKDMSAKIWEYRLEHLLGAIKSTGTGEDTENAWYVIYPVHEYDLIQVLGYEATDAAFLEPGYDYLTVQPTPETAKKFKDKVAKGFYFNVVPIQEQYLLKHPEENEDTEDSEMELDPDDIPAE